MVKLKFPNMNKNQIKHIFKAMGHLNKAKIRFDSGYNVDTDTLEWHLDWSLKGAIIE